MVHVSSITGSRIQTPSEVIKRGDRVKVKVMSVVGTKVGLSMKDVDQRTGADLSYVTRICVADSRPHLYVKTQEELANDERRAVARAASGSNTTPLIHVDERKGSSAKRLSSPERFEIKQLIASGAVKASDVSRP
jgi:ATP-dependent RNA helicase DHX8/PRP22